MNNKKKIEKKVIIGVSIAAAATLIMYILIAIVFFNLNIFGFKSSKDMMLEFVTEKYGETFVADTFVGASWAYHYDKLYAHSASHPEDNALITYVNKDGKGYISDNYFGILIRDDYINVVEPIVKSVFGNSKMDLRIKSERGYSDKLVKGVKVSEIYDIDRYFDSSVALYIPQSFYGADKINQADVDKLISIMKDNKLPTIFLIYLVDDDIYSQLNMVNSKMDKATNKMRSTIELLDQKYFVIGKDLTVFY